MELYTQTEPYIDVNGDPLPLDTDAQYQKTVLTNPPFEGLIQVSLAGSGQVRETLSEDVFEARYTIITG